MRDCSKEGIVGTAMVLCPTCTAITTIFRSQRFFTPDTLIPTLDIVLVVQIDEVRVRYNFFSLAGPLIVGVYDRHHIIFSPSPHGPVSSLA
jgi:hypothetical protein